MDQHSLNILQLVQKIATWLLTKERPPYFCPAYSTSLWLWILVLFDLYQTFENHTKWTEIKAAGVPEPQYTLAEFKGLYSSCHFCLRLQMLILHFIFYYFTSIIFEFNNFWDTIFFNLKHFFFHFYHLILMFHCSMIIVFKHVFFSPLKTGIQTFWHYRYEILPWFNAVCGRAQQKENVVFVFCLCRVWFISSVAPESRGGKKPCRKTEKLCLKRNWSVGSLTKM